VIAVDTSALMAVVLGEPQALACVEAFADAPEIVITAATVTEALIVATRRGVGEAMSALFDRLPMTVAVVDEDAARRAADAHGQWGKGRHAARLNYGDCFAYEVAQRCGCPLLFVGDDFSRTDIQSAL
jgi:ribonuclease VapC